MQSRFLLNVVIAQRTAVLELLSGENQTLLIGRDAFLVLNLGLDVIDSIRRFHIESDGLSRKRLHENLHTTTEAQHQMESTLLLDVVVTQGTSIFELFSSENKTLLIGWDSLLVLNLGLHVVNRIRWFHIKRNGLSSQSLDEDLHSTTETQHQVKGAFLLDVVVAERTSILQLLAGKNQTLLIGRDAFLILNLGLHVIDRIRRLDIKGDGLSGEGFHEDLHGCWCT